VNGEFGMKKAIAITITVGIIAILLRGTWLLVVDAAKPNSLDARLQTVEIGMKRWDVQESFGRPPDSVKNVEDGELCTWLGGADDRASILFEKGRVADKTWVPGNNTLVEMVQNRLGMPWWRYTDSSIEEEKVSWHEMGVGPGISIRFPGRPKHFADKTRTQFRLVDGQKDTFYNLDMDKLPEKVDVRNKETVKAHLDLATGNWLAFLKESKIVFEKDFMARGGRPGRIVHFEADNGACRVRFILTPNYLHTLSARGSKEFVDSNRVERFFESFRVFTND
jgi:hypothetical protein